MNATPALAAFQAALMAAPATLQQQLAEPIDGRVFAERARAFAAAQGIDLSSASLDETHRTSTLLDRVPPPGWWPGAIRGDSVTWLHFAGVAPDRPFFEDAERAAAVRPLNRLIRLRTSLDTMIAAPRGPAPAGFVFHMSRCGSTLVAQMLGAAPGHVALSEPPALDTLIRGDFADPERQLEALRAWLGQWSRASARLYVKLDAWHMRALPLLRRAFPEVPWIFLHRDPTEVLVSHRRRRGMHSVPGLVPLEWLGLSPEDAALPGAMFTARVLARICEAAVEHAPDGGLLVDYTELPDALFTRILPHFGGVQGEAALAAMAAAATRNAKAPHLRFDPDSAGKQREADPELRAAAAIVSAALSPSASPR